MLECLNGKLYTGITANLAARFRQHAAGTGAKFTRTNPPARMITAIPCDDRASASRLEWQVKQLKPAGKRALASTWPLRDGLPCREGCGPAR
jgi:putative endonuclease